MTGRKRSPHVYMPNTLTDTLVLKMIHPESLVLAGGSYILSRKPSRFLDFPDEVIWLGNVEELQRITRTERFFEIGSMVTLNHLLSTGKNVFPQILTTALSRIGNQAVRNIATIGGNLSVSDKRLTLFPVLYILDARLELRHQDGSRWVPINRFIGTDTKPVFSPGEILARVRIPLTQWSVQTFSGPDQSANHEGSPATFCAVAEVERDIISEFRFIFSFPGTYFVRSRDLEADLAGRRLPLSPRLINSFMDNYSDIISIEESPLSRFQREQSAFALRTFLHSFSSVYE